MKRKTVFAFISLFLFLASCNWNKDRLRVDLSAVKIPHVTIHRYDKDLFAIPVDDLRNGLSAIQARYLFFLGTNLDDTAKLTDMRVYLMNPRNIDFYQAVQQKTSPENL